ncbi:IS4 family transposase [Methylobacterium sp. GC_Met_2]|uniref:IS4 family transposase n=1 Tax=Methylobacterium sp. GC_Met_2 TaxID=2937376 RepID=UPI00226B521C|nr:IS4 family transposase [Methylobacterium sp. GC_Met_2]
MSACLRTALIESLSAHLGLGKSRLETLSMLLIGLIHSRTVNLTHIASQCHGPARYASKYRRLQRFFQHVRLDQAVIATLVVRMLKLTRPKCLALDRTRWKLGRKDVNILMLAIVTRRFRVPLLWSVLAHPGNSDTAQRIGLLQRYLALFEPTSIDLLLADREFIGADWFAFLAKSRVPFAIRVRPDLFMARADGSLWSIETLLRTKRARHTIHTLDLFLPDTHLPLKLAAKRLASGVWLLVMTNTPEPRRALQVYRRRWGIECLFGDAKTRGLNLEDTRLTDPAKIETLTAVLTLAITWIYRTATAAMGLKAIARKTHGRRGKSWFRTGLDALRGDLLNAPQSAATLWANRCPKRLPAL